MPFDNFVTGAVAHELNRTISPGRIERIYQPAREEIILRINLLNPTDNGPRSVDILLSAESSHPAAYITENKPDNPQHPPAFCMLLRKHILGGRIKSVKQVDGERIIHFDIESTGELGIKKTFKLILEIMGKHSNIFLVDTESNTITDCVKRIFPEVSRVRQALPGMTYSLPPPGKGMGKLVAQEVEQHNDLMELVSLAAKSKYTPRIYFAEGNRVLDFHVLPIKMYEGLIHQSFDSVSKMLETYYDQKDSGNRKKQKTADLTKAVETGLDKLYLKKQRLLEDLKMAEQSDIYRLKGELITSNIYAIEKGMSSASLPNYVEFDPETGEPEKLEVTLDPLKTPAQNAQQYFKRYSKAKTSVVMKGEQLKRTNREISFLESYKVFIDTAKDASDLDELREELSDLGYLRRKKKAQQRRKTSAFYKSYKTSNGLPIIVGKNNRENDELTFKKAAKEHLWLHTKDIPGSHVILAATADKRDEISIKEAAAVAAFFSKAKDSSNVPVDYVEVRYVKKTPGGKPGMVTFTHNKTVYVNPKLPE
jgi:predicted ribosome quality control (RQC) complex YloA/Tae2 family protein